MVVGTPVGGEMVNNPSAGLFTVMDMVILSPILYADLSVETVTESGGPTCTTVMVALALAESAGLELVAVTVNGYVPGQYSPGAFEVEIVRELLPDPPNTFGITIGLGEN
jgi:hypothetical protein